MLDEDAEFQKPQPESEDADQKSLWSRPGAVITDVIVVLVVAVLIYVGVAKTAAIVLLLLLSVALPATLLWFVWHVFLRKLWRVRRMRSVQEKRELLEAAMRGRPRSDNDSEKNPH